MNQFMERDSVIPAEFSKYLSKFVLDYCQKPPEKSDADWLTDRLCAELPQLAESTAAVFSQDAAAAISAYDRNLSSLAGAKNGGKTVQEWFWEKAGSQLPEGFSATSKEVSQALGQELLATVQSATESSGYGEVAFPDFSTEAAMVVADTLASGEDTGLKMAVTGALHAAISQEPSIYEAPPSVNMLANLASTAIENTSTLIKVSNGELTAGEAVEQMKGNIAVLQYDLIFAEAGRFVGRELTKRIPFVGEALCEIGGEIGYLAGKEIGKQVQRAADSVFVSAAKAIGQGFGHAVDTAKNFVHNLWDTIFN